MINFVNYNSDIRIPILISPDGFDYIRDNSVDISWDLDSVDDVDSSYIEIFFTTDYHDQDNTFWRLIGVVPANQGVFTWQRSNKSITNNGRIAIRSLKISGNKSDICLSNKLVFYSNFLYPPAISSPQPLVPYFKTIPFQFLVNDQLAKNSMRLYYRVLYSNDSLGLEWQTLISKLPISASFYRYDASSLQPSDDYKIQVYITDGVNASEPVVISDIQIKNNEQFIIDTVPPDGGVDIVDNDGYSKIREILLRLNYIDKTTRVKSFKLIETSVDGESIESDEYDIREYLNYKIKGSEGFKTISVVYRDIVDNVFSESDDKIFFRTFFNNDNHEISVFYMHRGDSSDIWIAYNDDNYSLYHNRDRVISIGYPCTAIIKYNGILYLGLRDIDHSSGDVFGTFCRFYNNQVQIIESFQPIDSYINSFIEFNGNLYMGTEAGDLYMFNNKQVELIESFDAPISRLGTDSRLLFIGFKNSKVFKVLVDDGSDFFINDIEMGI